MPAAMQAAVPHWRERGRVLLYPHSPLELCEPSRGGEVAVAHGKGPAIREERGERPAWARGRKKQTDCSRSSLRFCEKSRRSGNRPFILRLYFTSMQHSSGGGHPRYSQSCLKWGASLARDAESLLRRRRGAIGKKGCNLERNSSSTDYPVPDRTGQTN